MFLAYYHLLKSMFKERTLPDWCTVTEHPKPKLLNLGQQLNGHHWSRKT
jgi:hypothetical protein